MHALRARDATAAASLMSLHFQRGLAAAAG
jgi:DNA-binding GntR family transcriptional regulator